MSSAECVQRAYLFLDRFGTPDDPKPSTFDPDEVTRLVGLRPTESWRRGDPIPGRPIPRRHSGWKYELPKARTYLTEDVVTPLLDAIEPHAGGIAEACAALGLNAGINVVIEMTGDRDTFDGGLHVSTAAITYSPQTLKRLARLDVRVDHDQYVYLPE